MTDIELAIKAGAKWFPNNNTLVVHGEYGSGDGLEYTKKLIQLVREDERTKIRRQLQNISAKLLASAEPFDSACAGLLRLEKELKNDAI